jgi:DNA-binding response OmpR family regulator
MPPRIYAARILLVSDEPTTARTWAFLFAQKSLVTELAASAGEALVLWEKDPFDLVVIDEQTPALDCVALCRRLRAVAVNPILLLPLHGEEAQVLRAYEAGADECIVKPVSPRLLLAKVLAWQHQAWKVPTEALPKLHTADVQLDPARRELVMAGDGAVNLTNLEFRLLHLLISQPGRPSSPACSGWAQSQVASRRGCLWACWPWLSRQPRCSRRGTLRPWALAGWQA